MSAVTRKETGSRIVIR